MKRLGKSFLSISIITLFLLIFTGITQSYAAIANPAVRYGVISVRPDIGYGYLVNGNDKVWKIVEYNNASNNPAVIDYSKTIYCLKQGLGFGSGGIRPNPEYYDTYFDMKKDYGTMPANYKAMLPAKYNEVLWLLDNIYVADGTQSSKQEKQDLLAKVFKDDLEDDMLYPPFTMEDIVLRDSDIDVVQQLAIWYFTNPENDYLKNNINLYISSNELAQPNEFKILSDKAFDSEDGYYRLEQANKYFNYLKREAIANANNYGSGSNREENRRPIELSKTGITIKSQDDNYIIGPYKINEITGASYTLTATFKEESASGQTFNKYTLLDKNQEPTSKTINELVGENFYISVPKSTDVEKIVFTIDVEYYVRELQYWTVGDAPSTNQPLVIVKRIPKKYSDSVSVTLPKEVPEKVFDLSLRKFITAVNNQELRDAEGNLIREPQVDISKINTTVNGTYITTADYNHIKTPVSVKAGDIVTYTIRVYNEGEIAGYANEITDFLPAELEFLPNDELNKSYGWKLDANDSSKRTVKTNYLSKETESSGNHILQPFAKPNTKEEIKLDYKDVQIRCRVKNTNVINQKITNIAEITEYKDAEGKIAIDRDSLQDNVNLPPDATLPNYKDNEINSKIPYIPGQEDDDDFEKLVMKKFDLSLRKFITSVNGDELLKEDGKYLREPIVDVTPLKKGTGTTAIYNHTKVPVGVKTGDIVVYTIRVYNEGEVSGYANEIVDHLPPELEFIQDDELNKAYGWELDENDATARTIKTKYLSFEKNKENNLIDAFDKDTMQTLDYKDVKVKCRVKLAQEIGKKITNIADITEYKDENGNIATDIDSDAGNVVLPTDDNLPNYKDDEINNGKDYIPGQEDDDDFEKLVMKKFDLSLRKFITAVNGEELLKEDGKYLREPIVDVTPLKEGTSTTAIYNHSKIPVGVKVGDIVVYTIRVYNEGEVSGYANEIVDHLPPELEFIQDDELNKAYGWELDENDTTARTIKTNYLSFEKNKENNLIDAFDKDKMQTLDYKDVKVKCRIKEIQETGKKITNIADITEYKDENGNIATDIDSDVGNVVLPSDKDLPNYKDNEINSGKDYIPGQEDDDDFEKIVVKKFDLSLRKFITSVNGEELLKEDGTYLREPIVDVTPLKEGTSTTAIYNHTKAPVSVKTGDIVVYTIRVYNEGEVSGYANEIVDHLPAELEFLQEDELNKAYGWELDENDTTARTIKTNYLSFEKNKENNLIDAFDKDKMQTLDYKDVKVKCRVKPTRETGKKITNIADITEYKDENGNIATDVDSNAGNVVLPSDKDLPNYKDNEINSGKDYIPGQEDDDDFEKLIMKKFDLSLRKFITSVNGKELLDKNGKYIREPIVDVTPLKKGTGTTAIYNHKKVPVGVKAGDIVVYTIRVYNEGEVSGYANEIVDHLPPELEFIINDDLNAKYGWKLDPNDDSLRTIRTSILSYEYDDEENLINGFDKDTMETLDYKEIKVKCKVKEVPETGKKITNIADITQYKDESGNIATDIDSNPNNVVLPSDKDLPNYKDNEINSGKDYIPGQEDDDDFEKIKMQQFDLALRKFITKVNDTDVTSRIPVVDTSKLYTVVNGKLVTTATYTHPKDPILVSSGDTVVYTIRIYNEGDIAGYSAEIMDDMPEGLEFLPENEINVTYRWKMLKEDGTETDNPKEAVKITTDYLSKEQEKNEGDNLIPGFDKSTMTEPAYKDVKVAFKVTQPNSSDRIIINTAEITNDTDEDGNPVEDIDSTPDNNVPEEDDIDIEKIKVVEFDLALRKFITAVNDKEITDRIPQVNIAENGTISYLHTKVPVEVVNGNLVTYTLRIYNEGTMNGYAKEIKDDIPDGLEFVTDNEVNKKYRWKMLAEDGKTEVTNVKEAKYVYTDYLSKEQETVEGGNMIPAFDRETMTEPAYKDVKVVFKVVEPNTSDRVLINTAEITDDSDENGNDVVDKDSVPDNNKPGEDDIDIEKVKVKYFDLALKKWVTQAIVTQDGKTTVTETGHTGEENPEPIVKVDLHRKDINKVTVKFKYNIKVTNEGEIEGYVKEITDHIPEGLRFEVADNLKWTKVDENTITTDQLKDTLLKPGESKTVEVILTWINSGDNMGVMTNIAEISKDYNDSNTPDIDSTPGNQVPGEDDIDDAPVMLTVTAGEVPSYVGLGTIIVAILAGGIFLIKKYVFA